MICPWNEQLRQRKKNAVQGDSECNKVEAGIITTYDQSY